jgi:hypothetical protein
VDRSDADGVGISCLSVNKSGTPLSKSNTHVVQTEAESPFRCPGGVG